MNGHDSTILCIYNSKGGCSKTTTTINVAGILATEYEKRVLIVDADTSANATDAIGRSENPAYDFASLLVDYAMDHTEIGELSDAICRTNFDNIDIIPCVSKSAFIKASKLMSADSQNGNFYFADFFEQIEDDYDFILIDVGAGNADLNPLASNALNCADAVLVPFFADAFDINGLHEVISSVSNRRLNPKLKVAGVFLNRFKENDSLQKYVRDNGSEAVGESFIPVTVRDSAEVANAVLAKKPICLYRPKNAVVQDFRDLVGELLERLEAL